MNLFWRQGRRQISGLERLQWGNRTTFGGLCPVTDHKWRLLALAGAVILVIDTSLLEVIYWAEGRV